VEGGFDQRGEGFDVGAHDHDVPGFERGVVGEGMEDGVAGDLDLAAGAVTGMDLDRTVCGVERGVVFGFDVGADAGLDAAQQGVGRRWGRRVVDGVVDGEGLDEGAEAFGVPAPGAEQAVAGAVCARVGPGAVAGMEDEEMDVPGGGDGLQRLSWPSGTAVNP
jgi:hypothetical protein